MNQNDVKSIVIDLFFLDFLSSTFLLATPKEKKIWFNFEFILT